MRPGSMETLPKCTVLQTWPHATAPPQGPSRKAPYGRLSFLLCLASAIRALTRSPWTLQTSCKLPKPPPELSAGSARMCCGRLVGAHRPSTPCASAYMRSMVWPLSTAPRERPQDLTGRRRLLQLAIAGLLSSLLKRSMGVSTEHAMAGAIRGQF